MRRIAVAALLFLATSVAARAWLIQAPPGAPAPSTACHDNYTDPSDITIDSTLDTAIDKVGC